MNDREGYAVTRDLLRRVLATLEVGYAGTTTTLEAAPGTLSPLQPTAEVVTLRLAPGTYAALVRDLRNLPASAAPDAPL